MEAVMETPQEVVISDEMYNYEHNMFVAEQAAAHGYPIAGGIGEAYLDAVIMIPPIFSFDWKKEKIIMGRVLHITRNGEIVHLVIQVASRAQVRYTGNRANTCYFALPENSENAFR